MCIRTCSETIVSDVCRNLNDANVSTPSFSFASSKRKQALVCSKRK